ncbi:MAG TPA: hypothetical protein VHL77_04330, partial [Ferruginibacter sp.]|nr:hypothetical protein [Ferruginibacter sp.]
VSPEPPPPPAKPGNLAVVMIKVANFEKWLPDYESHDSIRQAFGLHNFSIARGVKDSNTVMIVLKMDDVAKAKEFAASPDLKARMKKGGVVGPPTISYLDMQMQDMTPSSSPRLMVKHKVKDYDAWKKVFDADKPNRVAAGLTDRALGYEIGDNHMVSIVFLVSDMKKAEDMSKSPDLKKKMEEGGVEGAPTFFYYNQVKKY